MRTVKIGHALVVGAGMLIGAAAQAQVVSGSLWHVPELVAQNAIPANVPSTTPNLTFSVNSPLNFNGTTVQTFLSSGGAFNIVENVPGTLASPMDNLVAGTIIQFLGTVTVTTGQTFTVAHDDGLTLIIGGTNLNFSPGPTAPITSVATYTGPSGNLPFQLVYGECCAGSAVLAVNLPFSSPGVVSPAIPEPGTISMLGLGLVAGMGYLRRRKAPLHTS
ncbi:MAG: PEP-CTERM sorting domain-containing protein [Rhodospirillaceae bacterium]